MAVGLQRWGKVLSVVWWGLTSLFSDPVSWKRRLPMCVWCDVLLRNRTPHQHAMTFTFIGFFPWSSHKQLLMSVENCITTNCFCTFCAYKARRLEWRGDTKVIMRPIFIDENLIWNCPDFFYKEMVHACAVSSERVFIVSKSFLEKHVFFPFPE